MSFAKEEGGSVTHMYAHHVRADFVKPEAASQRAPAYKYYSNLTPWVLKSFFVHSYYAYIFVFYMFLIMFYKSYALQYPPHRAQIDMVLVMFIPLWQHAFFYFGYHGCDSGSPRYLQLFLGISTSFLWVLMYFFFKQAYIMPIESKLCFFSALLVVVEGSCGVVNILQTVTTRPVQVWHSLTVILNMAAFLATVTCMICFQFWPNPVVEVQTTEILGHPPLSVMRGQVPGIAGH